MSQQPEETEVSPTDIVGSVKAIGVLEKTETWPIVEIWPAAPAE